MISDGKLTKTKVVDFNRSYNFIVVDFFHLKSFEVLKVWFKFSQYEIQICQMTSAGKMTKTKDVHLDERYNYLKSFRVPIFILKS